MTVVSCPRCHDEVSLPVGAPGSARVRCPLCSEEYVLAEALRSVPPTLELLDTVSGDSSIWSDGSGRRQREEEAAERAADSGEFAGLMEMEPAQEDRAGEPEGGEDSPGSAFAFGGGAANSGTATATRPVTRPRAKKKKANPVLAFLPVVLGGLIALPLAQLVLWWLPGGYQRDPFELGPKVGPYIPFLVPANLRGGAGNGAADPVEPPVVANRGGNRNGGNRNNTNNGGGNNGGRSLPLPGGVDDTPGTGGDIPGTGGDVPGTGGDTPGTGGDVPGTSGEPEPAIGLKDRPTFTSDELGGKLLAAHAANEEFDADDGALSQAESRAYFETLCELAEAVTLVDPEGPQLQSRRQAVRDLLASFQDHEGKLEKLGTWGAGWLGSKQRTSSGVFLTGTVKQVEPIGGLFRTEIELLGRATTTVDVITEKKPGAGVDPGSQVALLGRVLDAPAEEINGYEGSAARAVWGGLFVVLP